MARRAMWKGILSFRNISLPVKLYAAAQDQHIAFHQLHDQDKVRLRQKMVCKKEGKPVESQEIAKAVEVDEDHYVLLEPEDLEELEPEADRLIDVEGFVEPDQVDPRYFDRPYHLGPDGDDKPFVALVEALAKEKKMGICRWSFRNRWYTGAMRSVAGTLEVVTLRTGAEVVQADALDLPSPQISDKERQTARYLVEQLSEDFDPSQYFNDFEQELRELVQTKAKGGKVKKRKAPKAESTDSDELLDALEASLDQTKKSKKSTKSKKSGKKTKSKKSKGKDS